MVEPRVDGAGDSARRPGKERLDQLLVARELYPSRERAQAAIMAGLVRVGGIIVTKSGLHVAADAALEVAGAAHPYVSRGGLKLARALEAFGVDPTAKLVLDAGASTGGFTDVLLQRGARQVLAVDVGYGQLAWALRQDPRVVVYERTNVRNLTPADISEAPDLIVADLSFISLAKVLPALAGLLAPGGEAIALIKPQFEAGRGQAPKGVVRDPRVHRQVLMSVRGAAAVVGWQLVGLAHSPIKGPEGNIEFLSHWRQSGDDVDPWADDAILKAVTAAHEALNTITTNSGCPPLD